MNSHVHTRTQFWDGCYETLMLNSNSVMLNSVLKVAAEMQPKWYKKRKIM